ncbi:ABC transporter, ATP-binding protein; putative dipeptide/oligopeptide/nickel transporter (modular protein) [Agrobacterium deltaense NCPPB 1641]|uniref:Glutathione import ATP-binding protein GsiA n=1 Tax=Agrobacterium deltaense NCPPB 1641 TaxID=1183425 RepID=A0A1S7UBF0_9HYPH|nr:ABC transporter, ATP-binding protein; putative dipeptide/oligopeptide/nickel transporter (modular protein) [Agrobacterium deltaense NCPPB 1641]
MNSFSSIWRSAKFRHLALPSIALCLLLLIAILAPVIAPSDPLAMDISGRLGAPSASHWLGQDEFGRDVLSRLLYGARVSLSVAIATGVVAALIGIAAGMVGGYFGGLAEVLTVRVAEFMLAFPPILLALLVIAFTGPGTLTLIATLAVFYAPEFARIAYGEVRSVKEKEYVEAMRSLGAGPLRIMRKTILPNIAAPLFVQFSLVVASAIVVESGLSFLGLGIVPPTPSWGLMIRGARSYLELNPMGLVWPCLALVVTIFIVNALCDAIRDVFDPRTTKLKPFPDKVATESSSSKYAAELLPSDVQLSVDGLRTEFATPTGTFAAVNGISFDLNRGETLAVVGESGSGKSVTSLSIMGLLPQKVARIAGGKISFAGSSGKVHDLARVSGETARSLRGGDMAMIFQEPMTSLNPVYKIGDQIAEAVLAHRDCSRNEARKIALEMLRKVHISDPERRLDQYPFELSGGMRQRVMIAMALACKPKLLIADEPTTALDVTIQAQILELIKELQKEEDMSILFITHDMGVVAEVADRTVVMYKGEAVEAGLTADIFAQPKHPYTRALLSAVPRLGSMEGKNRPMRFPIVDRVTGQSDAPVEVPDTVQDNKRAVLEVKGLTTRFDIRGGVFSSVKGRVHAVENVSFDVKAGETLALVGESGCGKSTTGRSILRLVEPRSGSVMLDGVDVLKLNATELLEQRKRMQMIFQDPFGSLNPRQNVGSAIADPLIINRLATRIEARDKVADLLERVGLQPDMATRFPHEFSGGQRQRICIARALALEPRLIVADEAVSALDVSVKAQVVNLMLDLQAQMGLAYLFISHDMAVVERVSHRIAVMYLGEIVEIGPRAAIFQNPQHPYTKRLLAAVPIADPARRLQKRSISNADLRSPVRPADFVPPVREYREISTGHFVMNWDNGEW